MGTLPPFGIRGNQVGVGRNDHAEVCCRVDNSQPNARRLKSREETYSGDDERDKRERRERPSRVYQSMFAEDLASQIDYIIAECINLKLTVDHSQSFSHGVRLQMC